METINNGQEQVVEKALSITEQKKKEAAQFVVDSIIFAEGKGVVSLLDGARQAYEGVKGVDYYKEQSLAKLIAYFEMQKEVSLRKAELLHDYPEFEVLFVQEKQQEEPKNYLV